MSEEEVPPPYRINKPFIEGISNSKIATNVKPGKSCMNWVVSDPIVEFINTKTGKTCDEKLSRLCKLSLFKRYLEVSTLMKKIDLSVVPHLVYRNCKELCQVYQQVKKLVFDDLENSARGKWIAKPKELNDFCVSSYKEEWISCILDVCLVVFFACFWGLLIFALTLGLLNIILHISWSELFVLIGSISCYFL